MGTCALLVLSTTTLTMAGDTAAQVTAPALERIAFGSCAKQDQPQPIWDTIIEQRPDLFLFIGDNIYADTDNMSVMRAKYRKLAEQPGYRKLLATCPVLAVWDDHDYGRNDAGVEYPQKVESQRTFLEFFNVPQDSPTRRRPGIYDAKVFGPHGKRVQVILLDTRYFRSPLKRHPQGRPEGRGPYIPSDDPTATMLGEAQWQWLREQLKQPAEVRVIVSSIQVIPDEHGWECWGNLPRERDRLLRLIADTQAGGVIFISGDRHHAELSRLVEDGRYPLYDLTSSGLNLGDGSGVNEPNRYRVGPTVVRRVPNFGLITIDWQESQPSIRLQVHNAEGKPFIDYKVPLSDLKPRR